MKEEKTLKDTLSGKERENMPDIAFRIMTFIMKMMDFFGNHSTKNFSTIDIKEGEKVVDYGCGPARYIVHASKAVGKNGKVYAVDIHPLAIEKAKKKIQRYNLNNVETVLADGYHCNIANDSVDVVYALDMFHMISKPAILLAEFARMIHADGRIIIEDGHQPRTETKSKILESGLLNIANENKNHVVCRLKESLN